MASASSTAPRPAGYAALIGQYDLRVPRLEHSYAIGEQHRIRQLPDCTLLTPRHAPPDDLPGQLTFALKYEGVQLHILRPLFLQLEPTEIAGWVQAQPVSAYARRAWFLYEWLLGVELALEDCKAGNYANAVDDKLQFCGPQRKSRRHRINNNLPGVPGFCPMIRRSPTLEKLLLRELSVQANSIASQCHPDVLARAAAFLLLADSKSSYIIEGEQPPHTRIERWGRILGEAGKQPLSLEYLEQLQRTVLADERFVTPGLRSAGGFVGQHDRRTGLPLPEHISAKAEDLPLLMQGLLDTWELLRDSDFPPVLLAALLSFGLVFIHPYEDGNGRLHRYLIHHVLAATGFVPENLRFPVSSVMLERIDEYRRVLQAHSLPRLECIDWQPTERNNVTASNETLDLYRYFDATRQAEFLYQCIATTVDKTLPEEIAYLQKYDVFTGFVSQHLDMPPTTLNLLVRFLESGNGKLSKRAREKEFAVLTSQEVAMLEDAWQQAFHTDS